MHFSIIIYVDFRISRILIDKISWMKNEYYSIFIQTSYFIRFSNEFSIKTTNIIKNSPKNMIYWGIQISISLISANLS